MPMPCRGALLVWGLALGVATAARGQGETSLSAEKPTPVAPVKESPSAPAPEKPASPAKEEPSAPAPESAAESPAVEQCQPLKGEKAEQAAVKAGAALKARRYVPAKKLIAGILSQNPEAGALHLGLAAAMARLGEHESASREYEAFLAACPKHAKAGVVRELLSEYQHTKGAQAFAAPQVDELAMSLFAQDDVKASCDEEQLPDEARTAYEEGVRQLNAHKLSQATSSFQHVLELEPGSMMALLMLGSVYAQTNRPDDAAQAYMMFVTQCPHHPRANEIRELLSASGVEGF